MNSLTIKNKSSIKFIWNNKFPLNSLSLMRGYLAITDEYKENYFDTCFDAYWRDNIDISLEENLIEILNKCKIDKSQFFNNIKDEKIKNQLKELTNLAFDKDIFGAPTFIVNNKLFWGQDRLDYALDEYNSI